VVTLTLDNKTIEENMTAANNHDKQAKQEFVIHRLFIKDLSFEAPHSPKTFNKEWKPEVDIHLDFTSQHLEDDLYDVTLTVTNTVKLKNDTAFIAEVKQAGIFLVRGFAKEQQEELLGSLCPNVLFPYAREVISSIVNRGGFPPLYLAPVNFDAIYQQRKRSSAAND
jgi:preprotein translocase subunit SecB